MGIDISQDEPGTFWTHNPISIESVHSRLTLASLDDKK